MLGGVALATLSMAVLAQDATELPPLLVVGTTPYGDSIDAERYPGNAQWAEAKDIARAQASNINELMARQFGGVYAVDAANNPYQADIYYRGYSTSPLLGLPQGMSIYQDGVRLNEPFGDTINWDLIPQSAIDRIELIPGSNPLFGLNTLGGAVSLRTKNGFDAPGGELELRGASYGRRAGAVSYGASKGDNALFLSAEAFEEDGWRDYSDSEVLQFFARASHRFERGAIDATLTAADNRLRGNGAAPIELLEDEGRESVFTYPDETSPRVLFLNLFGHRNFGDRLRLDAGGYYRDNRVNTFNGDGTEFEACEDEANEPYLCEEEDDEEEIVEDLDGEPVVATDANSSGTQNTSRTAIDGYGAHLTLRIDAGRQALTVGASYDRGVSDFAADTELASLTEARGTVGSGEYVGESRVRVKTTNDNVGLFLADEITLSERWNAHFGARWNRTRISLRDHGEDDDLTGDHRFYRTNLMLGSTYRIAPSWSVFGSISEASRAPTPVELTCANPEAPCKLPNGFVDDPPLEQVVTRTGELGLRYAGGRLRGSLSLFNADNEDDILFITDGNLTNEGYFDNVGSTRRQGAELSLDWQLGQHVFASLHYTWLRAEFRESFLVNTPNHPLGAEEDEDGDDEAADEVDVGLVESGDRIPLVPSQMLMAGLDYRHERFELGLELLARDRMRYRGDEANVDTQEVPGFAVLNLRGQWMPSARWTVLAAVDNVLDTEYSTFGVYGEGDEVLGEDYEDARRFVGAGAPRRYKLALRLAF